MNLSMGKLIALIKSIGGGSLAKAIRNTGFVEKLAPAWVALFTDVDVNTGSAMARLPSIEYSTLDLTNVKAGGKIPMKFVPVGELVLNPRQTLYAAEPSEAIATCSSVAENGYGRNTWTFTFDSNPPIFNDGNGDAYTCIKGVSVADNGAAYKVTITLDGRHPNSTSKEGTLALSLSVYVDTEQQAYDGLTLWSSTEGSKKRFELSVDDESNVALTDVDTGESKGLGGPLIVHATPSTDMTTATLDRTVREIADAYLAGRTVVCHMTDNASATHQTYILPMIGFMDTPTLDACSVAFALMINGLYIMLNAALAGDGTETITIGSAE